MPQGKQSQLPLQQLPLQNKRGDCESPLVPGDPREQRCFTALRREQYDQLTLEGYLDISSPRNAGCIYRVPRVQGPVIEQGRHKEGLRLQPLEAIPDADHVVIHKLLIEADEEAYLQTANTFTLITSSSWDD